MRIRELEARENLQQIMVATVQATMSHHMGREVEVSSQPLDGGQPWVVQPLLSAYYVPPLDARARHFVADSLRWTSIRNRAGPQWVVGTTVGSGTGLRLLARPAFWLRPAVPATQSLVIMPGNRRIRLFDFAAGTSLVWTKVGFDTLGMRREIALRSRCTAGPFVEILDADAQGRWFLEPIVDGAPLSRERRKREFERGEAVALGALDDWLDGTATETSARPYVASLVGGLRASLESVAHTFEEREPLLPRGVVEALAEEAEQLGHVRLARSHGDLQPSNIMVERGTSRVRLIDWECSARRLACYDTLTYGLAAQWPKSLAKRLRRFVEGRAGAVPARGLSRGDGPERRAAVGALFMLEHLATILQETDGANLNALPATLPVLAREASRFAAHVPRARRVAGQEWSPVAPGASHPPKSARG